MIVFTKARRTLATCCGVHVIHDGLSDIMYVLLPLLRESFGLSYSQIGMIRGAHRAGLALFQLPAGLLAERLGERNLLVLGTAMAGLSFIALGLSAGFVTLLLCLFLAGMGSATQHPLSASIISTAYAGGGRRAALGTYAFAGDVGKFAIAGGLSLLLAGGMEWRGPIMSLGAFTMAAAILVLVMLLATGAGPRPDAAARVAGDGKKGGWGIREPVGFSALCGIMIVDNCVRNGFLTFVAFLLIAGGVEDEMASMAVPVMLIGGMWGKLACGFLAERIGIVRTVVLTEIGTAVGIVAMILVDGVAAFFLLPLLGVALNGTSSVLQGTIGDLVERERQSRAYGLFFTISAACGIVAPFGFGILSDVLGGEAGLTASMAILAAVVLLTIPLCLILRPVLRATPVPAE